MNKKQIILRIAAYCLLVGLFVLSVGFASKKQSDMLCTGLNVIIHDAENQGFISETDVVQIVNDKIGSPEGIPLMSINKSVLEKIINANPFVRVAEVFSTIDGKLNIEIKQRIPVLRVINFRNESFYIDKEGFFMPPCDKFTAHVPVASGFIFNKETEKRIFRKEDTIADTSASLTKISQLFNIAVFAGKDDLWSAEIQQLYVNEEGDIEFIPLVGGHSVILGDDQYLEEKFRKLFYFYKEGLNRNGWDKYKVINLKYRNQVVCIKN